MAETRLYKIAHLQSLRSECCLPYSRTTAITESDQRVISPNLAIVLPACPKQLGCMGNDSTAWRIVLTSVWCRHANVEGISSASRRLFAARKRVQRRLRKRSSDVYVKEALTELASDFKAMAKELEQRNER